MKFTVGQASTLLGVSQSTVRRYERYSQSVGRRDTENNYRYYSLSDMLELATYIQIKRQMYETEKNKYSPDENALESGLQQARMKIDYITARIDELLGAKRCWEHQYKILELMKSMEDDHTPWRVIDYPGLVIDPIGILENPQNESLYFSLLRENSGLGSLCRMCTLWKTKQELTAEGPYIQAVSFYRESVSEALLRQFPRCITLPPRRYIVSSSTYGGIIKDNNGQEEINLQVGYVRSRIDQLIELKDAQILEPTLVMSVKIGGNTNLSLIMIPINESN